LAPVLGAVLGFVVGRVLGVRRAHVLAAMARAGIDAANVSGMYRSLGTGLFELVATLLGRAPLAGSRVDLDELERRIEKLRERGNGVVIATAHTGNWDVLACASAERVPLSVVTKRLHIGFFDRLWQAARLRRGVQLLEAGNALRPALERLRQNEVVAMLVDQAPERTRGTAVVPFLGGDARVDLSAALVAERARAPIAVVLSHRTPSGKHTAELVRVIEPSRGGAEQTMAEVTRELETFVRRHPSQWLWMHRRWKDVDPNVARELELGRAKALPELG
jgi:KDO2-lipid IV(A) lauroyltransferase